MGDLAIVIPAYKIDFFKDTLESLKEQTCKDFTVYVGDDCSPNDFYELIDEYKKEINIVYHRFNNNLGAIDLVGQWERCLSLIQNEKWVWLFSDDDILGKNCIELFYNEIRKNQYDIYHFDVKVIDEKKQIVAIPKSYPEVISSEELYKKKCAAKIESFVVENIFSRSVYKKIGGFKNFDLAWGSDLATWVLMAEEKGMKSISGDNVYWRRSTSNITPNISSEMVIRKLNIDIQFIAWANNHFKTRCIHIFNDYYFFRLLFHYSRCLNWKKFKGILSNAKQKNVINSFCKHSYSISYPVLRIAKTIKG